MSNKFPKIHPGRILLEEYLAPRGVSVWHLARDIGVPVRRIYEIVEGQRRSPPTSRIASRTTSACPSGTGSIFRRGSTGNEKINCRKRSLISNRYGLSDNRGG